MDCSFLLTQPTIKGLPLLLKMSSEEPLPTFPFMKRDATLFFSATKPPLMIKLWNTQTFEQLQRHLIGWLDGNILEGEKIRKIERQVTAKGPNGEVTRSWRAVKNDAGVLMMMLKPDDIVLMVVIS